MGLTLYSSYIKWLRYTVSPLQPRLLKTRRPLKAVSGLILASTWGDRCETSLERFFRHFFSCQVKIFGCEIVWVNMSVFDVSNPLTLAAQEHSLSVKNRTNGFLILVSSLSKLKEKNKGTRRGSRPWYNVILHQRKKQGFCCKNNIIEGGSS